MNPLGGGRTIGGVLGRAQGAAFSPLSLSPALWLDASQITGLSDGAAVATWPDVSGDGRNATQITSTARPTYRTGIVGGKPVVRFDGGDWLSFSQLALTTFELFLVIKKNTVTLGNVVLALTSKDSQFLAAPPSAASGAFYSNFSGALVLSPSTIVGTWQIVGLRRVGGIADMAANGTDGAPVATDGALAINSVGYYVLASYFLTGDIAEIIVFDSALSDANRQAVEAYLSAKYSIALA